MLPFPCCCSTSAKGNSVVTGIQLGNVWIGVQVSQATHAPAADCCFPLITSMPSHDEPTWLAFQLLTLPLPSLSSLSSLCFRAAAAAGG